MIVMSVKYRRNGFVVALLIFWYIKGKKIEGEFYD